MLALRGAEVETVVVRTTGDRLASESLDRLGGQGVFAREVQAAVLEGRADAAVHSAKDLPPLTPEGLVLAAVPVRADPRDVLVGATLDGLPAGAVVATGSARRRAQLAHVRPDLTFAELRGNIATRLAKVSDGPVNAVVTSMAALGRLDLEERATEILATAVMLPQVGQGALAVEHRADDPRAAGMLADIDDPVAHRCLSAERAVLLGLGSGCAAPCGALATVGEEPGAELFLTALVASGDGRVVVRAKARGADPEAVGRRAVRSLLDERGAAPLLEEAGTAGALP